MRIFFKNVGVLFIFFGFVPFLLMFEEGFESEVAGIGLFSIIIGVTLFYINKED